MVTWLSQLSILVYCEPVVESCSIEDSVYLNAQKNLKNINLRDINVRELQNRYCVN